MGLNISDEYLPYALGGLLYMPAFQDNIIDKILGDKIPCLTSVAFCLEDSVKDDAVDEAETALIRTLNLLARGATQKSDAFTRILSGDGQPGLERANFTITNKSNVDLPLLFRCACRLRVAPDDCAHGENQRDCGDDYRHDGKNCPEVVFRGRLGRRGDLRLNVLLPLFKARLIFRHGLK